MAFHIIWVGSAFPEVLEEVPATGFTLSETLPAYLFKSWQDMPEKMMQEELVEYPDFLAEGQRNRACMLPAVLFLSDTAIPFKEAKASPYHPEGHHPPPKLF